MLPFLLWWVRNEVLTPVAEMLTKCSTFHECIPGMERGGRREEGKKLDGCKDPKTLWGDGKWIGRNWNSTNAKEQSEKKSRLVFTLPISTAPRKVKPGLAPTSRCPAPRAAGCEQPLSFREHRDERVALEGSISAVHMGWASRFLFQDKFSVNNCGL